MDRHDRGARKWGDTIGSNIIVSERIKIQKNYYYLILLDKKYLIICSFLLEKSDFSLNLIIQNCIKKIKKIKKKGGQGGHRVLKV